MSHRRLTFEKQGEALRLLRGKRAPKEAAAYSAKEYLRFERGERRPPRKSLLETLIKGLRVPERSVIDSVFEVYRYEAPALDEIREVRMKSGAGRWPRTPAEVIKEIEKIKELARSLPRPVNIDSHPKPQKTRWTMKAQNDEPGIKITYTRHQVLPWSALKPETEERLLPKVKLIPPGSTVEPALRGKEKRGVKVLSPDGGLIARIWFGYDPNRNGRYDGLVHVGSPKKGARPKVWQVFQRYSDATYLEVKSYNSQ